MPVVQPSGAVVSLASGIYSDAVFAPQGSQLYAASGNSITVINAATRAIVTTYTVGTALGALDLSPDGKYLAVVENQTSSGTGTVYRIDLTSGVVTSYTTSISSGRFFDVSFLANGTLLLSQHSIGASSAPLRILDFSTGGFSIEASNADFESATLTATADRSKVYVEPLAVTQSSYIYASGVGIVEDTSAVPDPYGGASIPSPGSGIHAISNTGNLAVHGNSLNVYDGNLDFQLSLAAKHPYLIDPQGLAFSPTGDKLYVLLGGDRGQIVVLSTTTWDVLGGFSVNSSVPQARDPIGGSVRGYGDLVQASPDGKFLSVVGTAGVQAIDLSLVQYESGQGADELEGFGVLLGFGGDDVLTATGFFARLYGGSGDDVYNVASWDHYITEQAGEGHDTVRATASYGLDANLEDLILDGSESIEGYGNNLNNLLRGNGAANVLFGAGGDDRVLAGAGDDDLSGGTGADTLDGGSGSDIANYNQSQGPIVVDLSISGPQNSGSEGMDTLISIEGVTGSFYDDRITGNSANNTLAGWYGDDTLIGGRGADTLYGEAGNDHYEVDALDTVVEQYGEGLDTVESRTSYILPINVENLLLLGSASVNGTGNVSENLLRGNDAGNMLSGLEGDDRLYAYAGNDSLDGGAGVDRMYGGLGNDTYFVRDATDYVYETAGEGTDRVYASVSHTLRANVELLYLTGTSALNGRGNDLANSLYGGAGANRLNGLAGDDRLYGGEGNDVLDGGVGVDRLYGGLGDDRYIVSDATDYTYELAGEGSDRVYASISHTLRANVEVLYLTGTSAISGRGNDLGNLIQGNQEANGLSGLAGDDKLYGRGGADVLDGGDGRDWLEGGAARDRLIGGTGADSFVFRDGDFGGTPRATADRIQDFNQVDGDRIRLDLVDADTLTAGDQAFTFVGTAAFSNIAGELRYEQVSGNTYLSGDTDGNGVADFTIRLDGLVALGTNDLVL